MRTISDALRAITIGHNSPDGFDTVAVVFPSLGFGDSSSPSRAATYCTLPIIVRQRILPMGREHAAIERQTQCLRPRVLGTYSCHA